MLDSLTIAVWLSVRLNASAWPFMFLACFLISSGSADLGGPISAVTAKRPSSSTLSRSLPDLMLCPPSSSSARQ
jgi:hypothetical protein